MDIFLFFGKIFLLPFICVLTIYFFKVYIDFQFILTFGVLIILLNRNKIRRSSDLSLIYSIVLSFLVLILSMSVGKVIYYLKEALFVNSIPPDILKRLHIIPKFIVSPLLMFFSYKMLFNFKSIKYVSIVKWSAVFLLTLFGFTQLSYDNKYLFMFWQFVMALALQLILYQDELKTFFKKE